MSSAAAGVREGLLECGKGREEGRKGKDGDAWRSSGGDQRRRRNKIVSEDKKKKM